RFQTAEEFRSGLMAVDLDNAELTPPAGLTLAPATPARPGVPRLLVGALGTLLVVSVAAIVRSGGGGGGSPSTTAPKSGLAVPAPTWPAGAPPARPAPARSTSAG